jgi:hypothetical protein
VIFVCCEHAYWYFYHFLGLQVNSILNLNIFLVFADRAGVENQSRGDSQTKNRKTPITRRKRPSFRNGLGTVPGVYEAATVGGTCGVLKTSFWPNIASAHPNISQT